MFSAEEVEVLLDNPISYYRVFADMAGNASGAVFLSQLWYWTPRTKNPEGWIYKTVQDWFNETGLTRREIDTARKVLREKGIITEKLAGIPPKVHYKIQKAEFHLFLKVAVTAQRKRLDQRTNQFGGKRQIGTELAENAKSRKSKAPNQSGGKRQDISETTAEITTKSTKKTNGALERGGKLNGSVAGNGQSSSSLLFDLPGEETSTPNGEGEDDPKSILGRIRANAESDPSNLAELVSEIFALSSDQCRDVENEIRARGPGIAIQAAEWTLQEYRENAGQSYWSAFEGGWVPRKSIGKKKTEPGKNKKESQRQVEPEPPPSEEEWGRQRDIAQKELAALRAKLSGRS
jgi:hypothetical protein